MCFPQVFPGLTLTLSNNNFEVSYVDAALSYPLGQLPPLWVRRASALCVAGMLGWLAVRPHRLLCLLREQSLNLNTSLCKTYLPRQIQWSCKINIQFGYCPKPS